MGNQLFQILFEIYVLFYPTVDRNEYTCSKNPELLFQFSERLGYHGKHA